MPFHVAIIINNGVVPTSTARRQLLIDNLLNCYIISKAIQLIIIQIKVTELVVDCQIVNSAISELCRYVLVFSCFTHMTVLQTSGNTPNIKVLRQSTQ